MNISNFFSSLFSKKPSSEELVEKLISVIKEKTKQQSFNLIISPEKEISLFTTKLGGIPYWNVSESNVAFPLDEHNKPMSLLAQINFEEVPEKNELLPEKGILQFFVAAKDAYFGANFENPTEQKNFKIVFHKDILKTIKTEDVEKHFGLLPPEECEIPVQKEVALVFAQSESYPSVDEEKFEKIFQESVKEVFNKDFEGSYQEFFTDKNFENGKSFRKQFFQAFNDKQNALLGYPLFCQGDPRLDLSENERDLFDTTLLKLNSYSHSDYIMWGDMGVGNFLINKQALQELDFSKVLYYWDCF
ncbi:MAG: DUF1963 domain-containing protein [Spirochaetaceae bacterium]|nr:DUF1963 domain-containing protein [Spirochaetaceae bacterium]